MMKEIIISQITCQGVSPQSPKKMLLMAFTAPSPSNTTPKQSAAMMIHMNIALMFIVWTNVR